MVETTDSVLCMTAPTSRPTGFTIRPNLWHGTPRSRCGICSLICR